jgi:hypothetical protein
MISSQADDTPARLRAMDAWFTPGRFAAILATLICLTFFNIVTGLQTFFLRDFGVFTYPVAQYYRECFWRGELPLWNPLNYCGIPLVAQWNTSMLYPPSLFYLVFPLSWSLGVFNLAHLFLAGLGMYLLARRWLGNNFAASVAGIAFAFNGLSWAMLVWISNLAAWAWMPWVVLLLERAWREGGKYLVAGALAGALQMLTGAPEIILLTWLFAGALFAGQWYRGNISRSAMLGRIIGAGLLVTALCAIQLLPFLDLLKHSHRDEGYGGNGWSMPVSGIANFLEPLFHCLDGGQHGVFVQHDQYWVSSYYLGVGVLLLAGVAVWRVRDARVRLLAVATLMSVLMALGNRGGLYSLIKLALPQLGFMRYPIKFVVLAVFTLPLLAGWAVRWCQENADFARARKTLQAGTLVLLALLVIVIVIEWQSPMPQDDWPKTWHNAIVRGLFLILVSGILLFLHRAAEHKLQLLLRVALLLLLWMDVFTHAPDLSPQISRSVYEPGVIRAYLKLDPHPRGGEARVMQTAEAAEKVRYTALSKAEDDYLCRRISLYDNCNLLDDVPKIDGFFSLYLREMAQVLSVIYDYDDRKVDLKGLKDFLGVAYISASNTKELAWVSRTNYLPLVTAGQTVYFAADTNTLGYMVRPDFNPRQMVLLPLEAQGRVTAVNHTDAKIVSSQIDAQKLTLRTVASAPSMVVVAQGYYHPWHAYVDGKETEIFRANYAFQAVQVPAGEHQVKLVYEDNAFRLGAAISLGALAVCAGLWFWARRKPALQPA